MMYTNMTSILTKYNKRTDKSNILEDIEEVEDLSNGA
jgi:hypothetical protein